MSDKLNIIYSYTFPGSLSSSSDATFPDALAEEEQEGGALRKKT